MQSIFAREQWEHGCFLSHLTLRRRHVTQDRGLRLGVEEVMVGLLPCDGFWTRSLVPDEV